jgi:hypothetical protein
MLLQISLKHKYKHTYLLEKCHMTFLFITEVNLLVTELNDQVYYNWNT